MAFSRSGSASVEDFCRRQGLDLREYRAGARRIGLGTDGSGCFVVLQEVDENHWSECVEPDSTVVRTSSLVVGLEPGVMKLVAVCVA